MSEPITNAADTIVALTARVAELEQLLVAASEFRVWEPGYGLYVRRSPGATGFAILEARRTSQGRRAWTTSGLRYTTVLSDEELFCWPTAEVAVAEARRVLPGAVVRELGALPVPAGPAVSVSVDERGAQTVSFTSREERYESPLHHDYRVGHDLPEMGGA